MLQCRVGLHFKKVYTTTEVIRLVDTFLEQSRTQGLGDPNLAPGAEADKWCTHLAVAFEKEMRLKDEVG